MNEFSCLLTDVIRTTLTRCSYETCSEECRNYLWGGAFECNQVFNNDTYDALWRTLIAICFPSH